MRIILLSVFFFFITPTYSQTSENDIGGLYDWAGPGEEDPWGQLKIYPNSEKTFLFQLISSNGSGIMDIILGQATKISTTTYEYYTGKDNLDCKILFEFKDSYINVKKDKNSKNCSGETIKDLNENFQIRSRTIPLTYSIDEKEYRFEDFNID
jgi:hypothetical protein